VKPTLRLDVSNAIVGGRPAQLLANPARLMDPAFCTVDLVIDLPPERGGGCHLVLVLDTSGSMSQSLRPGEAAQSPQHGQPLLTDGDDRFAPVRSARAGSSQASRVLLMGALAKGVLKRAPVKVTRFTLVGVGRAVDVRLSAGTRLECRRALDGMDVGGDTGLAACLDQVASDLRVGWDNVVLFISDFRPPCRGALADFSGGLAELARGHPGRPRILTVALGGEPPPAVLYGSGNATQGPWAFERVPSRRRFWRVVQEIVDAFPALEPTAVRVELDFPRHVRLARVVSARHTAGGASAFAPPPPGLPGLHGSGRAAANGRVVLRDEIRLVAGERYCWRLTCWSERVTRGEDTIELRELVSGQRTCRELRVRPRAAALFPAERDRDRALAPPSGLGRRAARRLWPPDSPEPYGVSPHALRCRTPRCPQGGLARELSLFTYDIVQGAWRCEVCDHEGRCASLVDVESTLAHCPGTPLTQPRVLVRRLGRGDLSERLAAWVDLEGLWESEFDSLVELVLPCHRVVLDRQHLGAILGTRFSRELESIPSGSLAVLEPELDGRSVRLIFGGHECWLVRRSGPALLRGGVVTLAVGDALVLGTGLLLVFVAGATSPRARG